MGSEHEEVNEYERRRMENIKRNHHMISSLNINSRLSVLRSREPKRKKCEKKPLEAASRSSLRKQGIPPHFDGLPKDYSDSLRPTSSKADTRAQETVNYARSLYMRDVYIGQDSHQTFIDKFTSLKSVKTSSDHASTVKVERVKAEECIDFDSFKLEPWNVAQKVSIDVLAVRFLPTAEMTMLAFGNRKGELGFLDVGKGNQGDQAIHLYRPHADAISGMSIHPSAFSKVYTSSNDGLLKVMNIEREEFDLVYSSTSSSGLYSLSQPPNEPNSLYVSEGPGLLKVFDERAREIVNSWGLHKERINTIDVSPANPNIVATASSDGLACLWDLRKMDVKNSNRRALRTLKLKRSVRSAYFSPSGSNLASSVDGCVSVLHGANFEGKFKIHDHNFFHSSRAVWGWDDNHIFRGTRKRNISILSVSERKIVYSLESSFMSAISFRCDAHPYNIGMMAAATQGGSVYVWTTTDSSTSTEL